ncbi:hypothetical protein BV25DRAFT_1842994 [Artomyces pyxidatus]|uniref:Uncharacterized protein n=1 Tax=Artomyces pyxidatus TaxID=48021 RepID=A0ACB8SHX2_9AGAM|nr:hypothetical protein BV25DRAFT_1842994 [Artomyces pyxidatus]
MPELIVSAAGGKVAAAYDTIVCPVSPLLRPASRYLLHILLYSELTKVEGWWCMADNCSRRGTCDAGNAGMSEDAPGQGQYNVVGVRVDYGEKVKVGDRWRRNLVVQPNKGAKNEMLAKLSSPKTVLRMDYRRRYVAYRTCCAGERNIVLRAVKRCSPAEREENEKRAQGNWDEAYGTAGREKVEAAARRCTLATCIKHITEGPVESDPAIRD